MPTQHVEPCSGSHLDRVANAIFKARKVVVVTGAGISTNSGIPDFRSENGLYSLIQAQFDNVSRQQRPLDASIPETGSSCTGSLRPSPKRRKLSPESSLCIANSSVCPATDGTQLTDALLPQSPLSRRLIKDGEPSEPIYGVASHNQPPETPNFTTPTLRRAAVVATMQQLTTSPLSSPPPEEFIITPSSLRPHRPFKITDLPIPPSSSPLSSPPPVLFDPFVSDAMVNPSSDGACTVRQDTPPSDDPTDAPISSQPPPSSQTSNSSKNALPHLKGRDLFDASIWSDPLRTSVFYTFATTLRQKIKEAQPTRSHHFISHLKDRGKLVRCYTQNIDQMEEKVGLSTCLQRGPGRRGRFSRRSITNSSQAASWEKPVTAVATGSTPTTAGNDGGAGQCFVDPPKSQSSPRRGAEPGSGVECVFLHGSLDLLRCFRCGKVCSWDDGDREAETLSGQQPECPYCAGATAAREEKGKRALGVGKLRPDIVLYGEEHPSSHLISPIVRHDLALNPDMLLILGTSLRVHGLKVMVREFSKAVHSKRGIVVFVNFTKPPESSWGDVIDYWVQWDCDAWVADLATRVPRLWETADPPRSKKQPLSAAAKAEAKTLAKKKRRQAVYPAALRDTKATGAYWTSKVLAELRRIAGTAPSVRRLSLSLPSTAPHALADVEPLSAVGNGRAPHKLKRARKSAPGALEKRSRSSSTLNPAHGRRKKGTWPMAHLEGQYARARLSDETTVGSILLDLEAGGRPRVGTCTVPDRDLVPVSPDFSKARENVEDQASYRQMGEELKLPPLLSSPPQGFPSPYGRPQPLEPTSSPSGPLMDLSPNLRSTGQPLKASPSYRHFSLAPTASPDALWSPTRGRQNRFPPQQRRDEEARLMVALALERLRAGSPEAAKTVSRTSEATGASSGQGVLEARLMRWGSNWSCES